MSVNKTGTKVATTSVGPRPAAVPPREPQVTNTVAPKAAAAPKPDLFTATTDTGPSKPAAPKYDAAWIAPETGVWPGVSGEARTPADAIKDANTLINGRGLPDVTAQGATVLSKAWQAFNKLDRDPSTPRYQSAKAQVEANASLVKQALANLLPSDVKQFKKIQDVLVNVDDPVAQLSLQKLLLNGELPGGKAVVGNSTVLSGLSALVEQPLADSLKRGEVLSEVVQEVAYPNAIYQGNKGTCVATSAEINLAHTKPAEFVRIVSGLASPEGQVTVASGATLNRKDDALNDNSWRNVVEELVGPAFMELGNGDRRYDNATDKNYTTDGTSTGSGLNWEGADILLDSLYGKNFEYKGDLQKASPEERQQVWDIVKNEMSQGKQMLAGVVWDEQGRGHDMVISGMGKGADGKDYVEFTNPHSIVERWPKEQFLARVIHVNYDPQSSSEPASKP